MDTDETSPATAENPAPADGATPQTEAPAETTTTSTESRPATGATSDNIDEIRALMRENSDALVQSKRDPWTDFDEGGNDTPPGETTTDEDKSKAAAKQPGEEENQTAELTAEEKAKAEQEAAAAAAATEKPRKDPNRVRIGRFNEDDKQVIARMAEKDGLTIDQARAELISEGKIKAPAAATATATATSTEAKPTAAEVAATEIETQKGLIADLETKIKEAGTAFDAAKIAELSIEHNKAMAKLNRLEDKAEAARAQAAAEQQSQAQSVHQNAVAASEKSAVALFPDAGVEGSALFERIEDLMDQAPAAAFQDPNYPLTFAARAAAEIGYSPKSAAPRVVPAKPSKPAPPPGPASGANTGAPVTVKPTVESKAREALDSNDPEKIRAALREAGTTSLDDE